MADTRTLREKLEAMASQDTSPNDAAIAQTKLASMGELPPPPRRPTAVGAASGDYWRPIWSFTTSAGTSLNTNWSSLRVTVS